MSSSIGISSFGARSDGCGYFSTRRSVPSTTPGSTSSVVLSNLVNFDNGVEEEGAAEDEWMTREAAGREAAGANAAVCLISVQTSAVVAMGAV